MVEEKLANLTYAIFKVDILNMRVGAKNNTKNMNLDLMSNSVQLWFLVLESCAVPGTPNKIDRQC